MTPIREESSTYGAEAVVVVRPLPVGTGGVYRIERIAGPVWDVNPASLGGSVARIGIARTANRTVRMSSPPRLILSRRLYRGVCVRVSDRV